jgi:hypothetical protein
MNLAKKRLSPKSLEFQKEITFKLKKNSYLRVQAEGVNNEGKRE